MDGIVYLWKLVNNAKTEAQIIRAEQAVRADKSLDSNSYDELMRALAFKSREMYRRRR
jgi:hypothetical protein